MSKIPSADLFNLVKSLTKSDKRQFKLYAARHTVGGKNKYVLLFDAIDKQKEYNEEVLLKNTPSLQEVNLSSMKSHLYDLILRSLRTLTPPPTSPMGVQFQMDKAIILLRKGLFVQAGRLLAKTKKVALENEHLVKYLEIVFLEEELKVRQEETNSLERQQELHGQVIDTLDALRENAEHYHLFMQMHYLQLQLSQIRTPEQEERLQEFMAHPLLDEGAEQKTFFATMQFYEVHSRKAAIQGDDRKAQEYTRKKLELFDRNPGQRRIRLYEYLYTCGFYLVRCLHTRQFDEFERRLHMLKNLENVSAGIRVDHQINVFYPEFAFLLQQCRFDRARLLVPKIDAFIQESGNRIEVSVVLSFYLGFAILYLKTGESRKLLQWGSRMLSVPSIPSYPQLEELARILSLIAHFELGNDRALDSGIRSTYRYLAGKGRLGEFQHAVVRFMKRIPAIADRTQLQGALRTFHEELVELDRSDRIDSYARPLKIPLWLQSKIEGRPFADLLREEEAQNRAAAKEWEVGVEEMSV